VNVNTDNALEVAKELRRIQTEFTKPFEQSEVKVKPAVVRGNRCLALHYIDARLVMDRLDEVVGIAGWKDEFFLLPSGEVECRLSVKLGGEWITKADVGGQSEQPDDGDKMKAAHSDALKRAAVKFGIGRYLYRMPQQWMEYDPVKKQIVRPGDRREEPTKEQPAAEKPKPRGEPSVWARDIIATLAKVTSREDASPLWKMFESKLKDGTIAPADKDALDAAFAEFGRRCPKPARA
jgi:hypothetical protein